MDSDAVGGNPGDSLSLRYTTGKWVVGKGGARRVWIDYVLSG